MKRSIVTTVRAAIALALATLTAAAVAAPASAGDVRQVVLPDHTLTGYKKIVLDGHTMKWGIPVAGTGATVTYAVVDSAQIFPGARNCPVIEPLDGLLSASAIAPSSLDIEVAAAFDAWSEVANIQFRRVGSADADILIGAQASPRGRAFTNVVYDDRIRAPLTSLKRSVICLNPRMPWKVGFDGNLAVYDLRYSLTHEIGHAIGLDHPGQIGELMDFRYQEKFRVPQLGDIAGATSLYGPSPVLTASAPGMVRTVNDTTASQ